MTWQETLSEIQNWPVAERLDLVQAVWSSIAHESNAFPLSDELRDELDRRILDDDAHPDLGLSWDEIKAAVKQVP